MATEEDRSHEIERIHTEAVGIVLRHVCQIFDGIRQELSAEKKRLGFPGPFTVNGSVERECSGLIETIKANLADDLPIDPTNAVESEDHFDLLNEDEAVQVGERVRKTVRELLGVFEHED